MIKRIFGTILPALYVGHEGKQWTIAGTLMELSVVGDQIILPEGLGVYGRVTIDGVGMVQCVFRLRQFESDEIIFSKNMPPMEAPPDPMEREKNLSTFEFHVRLPIDRLYPAVAASSLGSAIKTTFVLELLAPIRTIQEFTSPETENDLMLLAVAPIYLNCHPRQTLGQGAS